ncbi:unnamed protein product [Medioppia subpectinata]|uniref:F-box domain-containing protein n=1 Tax=Medioppia subpectinata TaxID=1979941 RepID=A0A7R9QA46_9ACAR|nr:unnamed protein product [Medioppia subpectinata]CAG2116927.1 unnamed protein product [Medioppia subpectinata]
MTSLETTDDGNEDNKQQPKIYAKNSMDRFGDDLCALIVSYLTFEDRFRYECVSKQFQRTVFESVVDITLSDRFINKILKRKKIKRQLLTRIVIKFTNIETIDCRGITKKYEKLFESVVDITLSDRFINKILKRKKIKRQLLTRIVIKLTNIETIDCRGITKKYEKLVPEVLQIFRDNCRHLREIYCNLRENSSQTMSSLLALITRIGNFCKEFRIFGSLINGIEPKSESQSLIHCNRLSHLNVISLADVFDSTSRHILAKNLTKFESYYGDQLKGQLSAFVAHNQSLRSLTFRTDLSAFVAHNQSLRSLTFRTDVKTQETLNQMSVQLSRLTQLRDLRLGFELCVDKLSVNESLRTIGLNCKQLQRLTLLLISSPDYSIQLTLDSLGSYHRLKRLQLEYINIDINANPFKHCKRLTHLELILTPKLAKVLENCHQNCSRLQYLYIRDFDNIIDTECLSHISRLPALQTLVIHCYQDIDLSDNDLNAVLSSSPKLKTIEIHVNNEKKFYSK